MNQENTFDEDKAVAFIRKYVGENISSSYTDDEILYIIDIIWDYYEKNGMLTIDSDITEEELLDPEKLTQYVKKELANDHEILMDPRDVDKIVKAELEYEESLEDFV
ncbi:MAG: hypothetical protein NC097_03260 [Clostridium sp.]|nr:hypothetical protein [Prevotella sp.]MCM1428795.1 hypothetical protein [Clostridium sp.]MCM1475170.1 hypothetical protein [Muribaculaceae bacterium]